ncbi:MAG: hypothetical protein HN936_18410, partial [Bacteroidetes bacterium]|nr:hypothetical protein [Bacteroidota bacterium]
MKQAFIKQGSVMAHKIPEPQIKTGFVKIAVACSTISPGTEMSTVKGTDKGL